MHTPNSPTYFILSSLEARQPGQEEEKKKGYLAHLRKVQLAQKQTLKQFKALQQNSSVLHMVFRDKLVTARLNSAVNRSHTSILYHSNE